eukprot:jgi/Bigna1/72101/fgenesh1_pg.18_\
MTKLDLLWINLDGDLFDLQSGVRWQQEMLISKRRRSRSSHRTKIQEQQQEEREGEEEEERSNHLRTTEPPVGFAGRHGRAASLQDVEAFSSIVRFMYARSLMWVFWLQLGLDYPNGLRCSSLVKVLDGNVDIFFGHDTWDTYATAAPRIFKNLNLPVIGADRSTGLRSVSMSSSPGFLQSIDDYYLIEDKTKRLSRAHCNSKQDFRSFRTVLYFVRVIVANALSHDTKSWATYYQNYKSGSYNNQWMVLDLAKFSPGQKPLPADLFMVLEEAPGLIYAEDMTSHLEYQRYWPSFNVAFFPKIRAITGERTKWDEAVRYRLFSSLESSVSDLSSMKKVMGWNLFQKSPLSTSANDAIMARGDLVGSGRAGGGIDSKATSIMTIKRGGALTTAARAGPTNDDQPPFCWTPRFAGTPHAGHPHCYDFSWQSFEPKLSWFGGPSSPTVPPTGKDDKEKGDATAVKPEKESEYTSGESSVGGSFVFPSVTCGRDNAAQLDSSLKDVLEQRNPKMVTSEFQVSGLTLDDATTFVANAESNNVTALVGISFEQRYGSIRVGAVHIIPTENDGLHNTSAKVLTRKLETCIINAAAERYSNTAINMSHPRTTAKLIMPLPRVLMNSPSSSSFSSSMYLPRLLLIRGKQKRLGRGLGSLFSVVVGTIAGVCIFLAMLRHMVKGESNNSSAKGNEVPHVELQNMEDDDYDDNGGGLHSKPRVFIHIGFELKFGDKS